jgi:hypothetical protein
MIYRRTTGSGFTGTPDFLAGLQKFVGQLKRIPQMGDCEGQRPHPIYRASNGGIHVHPGVVPTQNFQILLQTMFSRIKFSHNRTDAFPNI